MTRPSSLNGVGRSPRRGVLAAGGALSAALVLPSRAWAAPVAQTTPAAPPNALAAEAVYFEETGHTVSGDFWRHWQARGLDAYGFPISESFEDGGVRNQYFQRARFELAAPGQVRLGMLGIESGGAVPPAPGAAAPPANSAEARLFPETGHVVQGALLAAYNRLGAVLGPPVGPEQAVPGGYIQYFANGRLEWDPFGGARLGLLGSEVAGRRGVNTTPEPAPTGTVRFSEYLVAAQAEENERRAFGARIAGAGSSFFPGRDERWVLVSIPQQRTTAYEGMRTVFSDLCSTGRADKGLTTRGLYAIQRRIPNEIMDSTTIGYPKGHPKYYRLENVLYTQYFNGGEALHYAWWHSNFGNPMSYGCVNLRLNTAKWFWDWANFGTRVLVV
jgi:lipoprotein-anchoring transpeptidase ErfK/SrfK